jgi:hypothetical protein
MYRLERNHPVVLGFFFITLTLVLLNLLTPVHDAAAQSDVTPRNRDRASVQIQVPSVNLDIETTLQAEAASLASTIEALSGQSRDSLGATVTAISAQIGNSSAELEALLSSLTGQGSVNFDGDMLTATVFMSEAQINALLDVLVESAGYDPNAASVDTQADGTVDVILVDLSSQLSGTLALTYELTLADGAVTVSLLSVSFKGRNLPADMLPEDLLAAVGLAVNAAAVEPMLSAAVAYNIDTLAVTDEGIMLGVSVAVVE